MLVEADRFLRKHDMKESTFGRLAIGDHAMMIKLRAGHQFGEKVRKRFETFLKEYEGSNGD